MRKRTLLLRGFSTLGMALWAAPVFLLAEALPVLPVGLLLALGVSFLPKKARLAGLAGAILISAFCGYLYGAGPWAFAVAALCALACGGHSLLLSRPEGVGFWITGILVYVGTRFALALHPLPGTPTLRALAEGYFVFLIFRLSLNSLLQGMGGGSRPSRQMTLRNLAAAGLLGLALLALSNLPQIAALLRLLWGWVKIALAWLSNLLRLPSTSGGGPMGEGGGLMEIPGEQTVASPFWLLLEKIFKIIAIGIAAVAVLFALRTLLRLLARAGKKLMRWLRSYAGAVAEGYEDTVESLVDWGEVRRALRLRPRREKRSEDLPWERLTPRQRVRRGMRDYLRRHPETAQSATARQLLDAKKAALYEAARYSDQEITAEDAESMRELK